MKNPIVFVLAIPLYIIKFVLSLVLIVIYSIFMAFGMVILGTDGSESQKSIDAIWGWFKKGLL